MTDKQSQNAASGSVAIQTHGDVTYNHGLSSQQMLEIMDGLSKQIQIFRSDAIVIVDERLNEFKQTLLREFSLPGKARTEAFADPDFQHALLDAQKAYARTDDTELHHILIDLIIQRSNQTKRSRLTLTLNDAITKSASLTDDEFNALAFAFLFQNVQHTDYRKFQDIAHFFSDYVGPIVDNVPSERGSYSYLEAHGCLLINPGIINKTTALDILKRRYPGLITNGLSLEMIGNIFPEEWISATRMFLEKSPFKDDSWVFVPGDNDTLEKLSGLPGMSEPVKKYLTALKSNMPKDEQIIIELSKHERYVEKSLNIYNETPLSNSRLTSVGIALAHAHLTNKAKLDADLSIWIR